MQKLEFHAQQRMWELEEDTRRAALAAAVRDELGAQQAEMEAKQRVKLKEWETGWYLEESGVLHWEYSWLKIVFPNLEKSVLQVWAPRDICTDEEARRLRFQAEAARRSEVAATAEAAAARNAAAREVLSMTLEAEDQLVKVRTLWVREQKPVHAAVFFCLPPGRQSPGASLPRSWMASGG